ALVERARRTLERYGPQLGRVGRVMPFLLSDVALLHLSASQLVIVGEQDAADTLALESVAAKKYLPACVQIRLPPDGPSQDLADHLPWVRAMAMRDGRATAYLCQDFACQEPVTDASALERQLNG